MKLEKSNISYAPRKAKIKSKGESFTKKNVEFEDTPLFFPEGFEKLFLAIYFVTLPYITGLLFIFFYISNGKKDLFLSLNDDSSFILTWALGYEICAVLAILWIIKSAITFSYSTHQESKKGKPKTFRRPV